jgi:hypothetical protein
MNVELKMELGLDLKAQIRKLTRIAYKGGFPRLYHVTGEETARKILADGFLDGDPPPGFDVGEATYSLLRGVWLSNRPLESSEGVQGKTVLIVQFRIGVRRFSRFEVIEEGKTYREWVMPAAFIARHAATRRNGNG